MEENRIFTAGDGARIAYGITRAKAPRGTLVLLHGLASNRTRWWNFLGSTRLAGEWNIIRPDLRGHSGSLFRGRVGMDVWCRDLEGLLRFEGIERAELVGHCMGANLAMNFAAHSPQLTAGIVLIEPMFKEAMLGQMHTVALVRPLLRAAVPVLRVLAALGLHRRELEPLDLCELDQAASRAVNDGEEFPSNRYGSAFEDLRIVPSVVFVQDLLAVSDPLPPLGGIRVPALALLSRGGLFGDPATTESLLGGLPDCRVEHLDALHWIPTEQPEGMREAIERWCSR